MAFTAKIVTQRVLSASFVVIWLTLALPAAAQKLPSAVKPKTEAPAEPEPVADPLGRSTPRGTISAFSRASHDGDLVAAARYFQKTAKPRPNTDTLARNLKELMDRYFHQPISTISDDAEGSVDDGLPLDREQVGPLKIGGEEIYIGLVRVDDKEAGKIWLISSETLSQVPALHASMEKTWLERVMPQLLWQHTVFGIPYARLIAWAASIAIPLLLLALFSLITVVLARKVIRDPTRRQRLDAWYHGLRWPSIFVLALGIHLVLTFLLGFSLRVRVFYSRFVAVVLVVALAWLIRRLLTLSIESTRRKIDRRDQTGTKSLMLLGARVLKVVVILAAIVVILTIVGVDTTTALAGVGIFGVAVALGAQKSVENILGGILLLTDKALAIGDSCSISDRRGTVEDITLRSVRLRTPEQTLLSIPAGVLAQDSIENFSTRGKIMAKTTLRLRYGTSTEQLRSILDRIHQLLVERTDIETGNARVRLVDFGPHAIEIELFAYVLTSDWLEFLAVREAILLQIAEIVESAGSGFARPEILQVTPESQSVRAKGQAP
jgi:MscS family membrane protein